MEVNLENILAEEGRVANRIYIQVGDPPLCHHRLPSQLLICRKEGPNFMKLFWRCASPRSYQCQFFMWTRKQPLLNHNQRELDMILTELQRSKAAAPKPKGRPGRPASSSDPPRVRPSECLHPKITKAGSNAFLNVEKCAICGEVLMKTMTELGRQKHVAKWGSTPPLLPTRREMREWQQGGLLEPRGIWEDPRDQ